MVLASNLQNRLAALAQAVGTDVKALNGQVSAIGQTSAKAFSYYVNAAQNLGNGLPITWGGKIVDTQNMLPANGATSIVLPAGVWWIEASVRPTNQMSAGAYIQALLRVNGTIRSEGIGVQVSGATSPRCVVPGVAVVSDGTTTIDVIVWTSNTGGTFASDVSTTGTVISGTVAGGATGPQGPAGGNATVPMDIEHVVGTTGEPAYQNGWVGQGLSYGNLRFRKDPMGRVRFSGAIKNGASGSTIFVLPVGYRPGADVAQNITTGSGGLGYVNITASTGVVTVYNAANGNVTSAAYLDGVEFDTDTVTQFAVGPKGDKGDPGGSATVPMDTWHVVGAANEPALNAAWVNYGGAETPAGFRKYPDGRVRLRGIIKRVVAGSNVVVWTLPSAYWPLATKRYLVSAYNNAGGVAAWAEVEVGPDGRILWYGGPTLGQGAGASVNDWIDLSSIEFDTETVSQFAVGPKGDKGDSGGVLPVVTLDWNAATAQGFYKSTNVLGQTTVNGPGDTLNPPPQSGYVQVHDNGIILQRVWDLTQKQGYARYRLANGTWTLWAPDLAKPPLLTDIPVGAPVPADGDERYFQSADLAALGVMWKFRYNKNSTSPYKWEFVGGSEWGQLIATNEGLTAASAWCNLATNGPLYTVPLAGDYTVEGSAMLTTAFTTAWHAAYMGFAIGDNNAFDYGGGLIIDTNAFLGIITPSLKARALAIAAGSVLKMRYFSTNGGNVLAQLRKLYVRPIRVSM